MNNHKLIWIGIQESEISDIKDLFFGSITIFGSGKFNNFSFDKSFRMRYDYNKDCTKWIDFVNKTAKKLIDDYDDCRFLLYYPMDAKEYSQELRDRVVAINESHLLEVLDNKFSCRSWLSNSVPILPQQFISGKQLLIEHKSLLTNSAKNVIQGSYSCGGSNTFFFSKESYAQISKYINRKDIYSITKYIEKNIPLNIHLIIYRKEIIILPGSIQLINLCSNKFEYCGADFIAFHHLPDIIKSKIYSYAKIIGERLQHSGYKGVVGIDFIATKNEVYFMEINPRFQSSTFLLNKAMKECHLQVSLQQLQLDSFENNSCSYTISNFEVQYSYRKFLFSENYKEQTFYLMERIKSDDNIEYCDDGFLHDMQLEDNTYLFKAIFNRNICSLSFEFNLTIHPNIEYDKCIVNFDSLNSYLLELKIMLLSHGIRIEKDALNVLDQCGGVNYKEFLAIDLVLLNNIYINVPYQMNLAEISPFNIRVFDGSLWLFYFDRKIMPIAVRKADPIADSLTTNGRQYSEICYLGNDRLRIYHRLGCYFKQHYIGCGFCDIENDTRKIDLDEIKEVVDKYKKLPDINHYLLGGGSQSPDDNFSIICKIAEYIRSFSDKPIYLMSLPPKNTVILDHLKSSGITQVAFNLEIFDRELAKKYMPGKGQIPLSRYTDAFDYSVSLWGKGGDVRTIFIVGLESEKSLLNGVEYVCSRGVSPILSLYKPGEATLLSYLLPPSDKQIFEIVNKVIAICNKYNVPLGPSCRFCEDNTLKITI